MPPGSALVGISACPAAGPRTVGVMPVIRRFSAIPDALHSPWGRAHLHHREAVRGHLDLAHLPVRSAAVPTAISSGRVLVVHAEEPPRRSVAARGGGTKPMKSLSYRTGAPVRRGLGGRSSSAPGKSGSPSDHRVLCPAEEELVLVGPLRARTRRPWLRRAREARSLPPPSRLAPPGIRRRDRRAVKTDWKVGSSSG